MILAGSNAGQLQRLQTTTYSIGTPGASASTSITKIYYSGTIQQFDNLGFNAFYGVGYGGSVSAGYFGGSASFGISYASCKIGYTINISTNLGIVTPGLGDNIGRSDTKKW